MTAKKYANITLGLMTFCLVGFIVATVLRVQRGESVAAELIGIGVVFIFYTSWEVGRRYRQQRPDTDVITEALSKVLPEGTRYLVIVLGRDHEDQPGYVPGHLSSNMPTEMAHRVLIVAAAQAQADVEAMAQDPDKVH